jgi:hypothetical protein
MELNDLIFLSAAIFCANSEYKDVRMAVKKAKALWREVLKQEMED